MLKKIKTTEKDEKKEKESKVEADDLVKKDNLQDVDGDGSDNVSLKELVEKNIKWSQVIYEQNKKIKHRLTMMVIGSYLRLALIIIPIILGIIYLPSLLEDLWGQYGQILGGMGAGGGSVPQINDLLGGISSNQLQEILKSLGNR
ncbi:hypothetical protein KJ785_01410 [Patescibacteria group bacterium]|nr:hypothetical protein [Patescibacteria group bacterium]